MPWPFNAFGRDPAKRIRERNTYQATNEGRRQIDDYLITGNKLREQILSEIVLRDGSCTMADLEAKTHQSSQVIIDEIHDMEGLGWITQRGGVRTASPYGGYPMGGGGGYPYPPMRR